MLDHKLFVMISILLFRLRAVLFKVYNLYIYNYLKAFATGLKNKAIFQFWILFFFSKWSFLYQLFKCIRPHVHTCRISRRPSMAVRTSSIEDSSVGSLSETSGSPEHTRERLATYTETTKTLIPSSLLGWEEPWTMNEMTHTLSMMSSRLPKWCVLQPSARSTSSWVACFLTAGSRSSAMPPSWGMTTISINSSWNETREETQESNQNLQTYKLHQENGWMDGQMTSMFRGNKGDEDVLLITIWQCARWVCRPHRAVCWCWERKTGCEALWS